MTRLVVFAFAVAVVSCTFVTSSCACDVPPPSPVVYGSILPAGVRASVTISSRGGACGTTGSSVDSVFHTTLLSIRDSYRLELSGSSGRRCVSVFALSGQVARMDSATLQFAGFPRDSARIDLRFQ